MITIATILFDANDSVQNFSRCYSEPWVDKLYRGFKRNLSQPFRFALFTDRVRQFQEAGIQQVLLHYKPHYGSCVECFRLDVPMIFVGLDTVIVGNVDHMANYCLRPDSVLALPKHPYEDLSINGVVLAPAGMRHVFDLWNGKANDMMHTASFTHRMIDTLFPGQCVSWKAHVRGGEPPKNARIIYFHGVPKPHDLLTNPIIEEHWR